MLTFIVLEKAFLSNSFRGHICRCSKMDKKIIVIGAGASGVAATVKLLSNGFKDVTILEGENRFGGRINTVPFGNNVLDLGAQW